MEMFEISVYVLFVICSASVEGGVIGNEQNEVPTSQNQLYADSEQLIQQEQQRPQLFLQQLLQEQQQKQQQYLPLQQDEQQEQQQQEEEQQQNQQSEIERFTRRPSTTDTTATGKPVFDILIDLPTKPEDAITEPAKDQEPTIKTVDQQDDDDKIEGDLMTVNKRFLFLNIKLTLNADMAGGSRRRFEVSVPVAYVISVFEAFVEAAASLRDSYSNADNPFNLSLQYSEDGTCLHIIKAFGLTVGDDHVWRIDVKKHGGKSVYTGVCVPGRSEIRVGPFYQIDLTYTHINSASPLTDIPSS